jgi:ABC-type Na+ transport system ATPase subunit NatA
MIGLIKPTSGTAYVHGMDINMDMGDIYTNMGVCPQQKYLLLSSINLAKSFASWFILFNHGNLCCLKCSLLWETLTGKEHLFFYGRLKNLKGSALMKVHPIQIPLFEHYIHFLVFNGSKSYVIYSSVFFLEIIQLSQSMLQSYFL